MYACPFRTCRDSFGNLVLESVCLNQSFCLSVSDLLFLVLLFLDLLLPPPLSLSLFLLLFSCGHTTL